VLRRNNPVEKFSKTALLAGAALAFPVASKASIVYVNASSTPSGTETTLPFTVTSPQQTTTDGPVTTAFTIDGISAFSFTADGGVAGSSNPIEDMVNANATFNARWIGPSSNTEGEASPLSFGADIGVGLDPSLSFYGGSGILQKTDGDPTTTAQKGPWPVDGSSAYLGIEFNAGGGLQYGWIQLSACTPDDAVSGNPCNVDPGIVTVSSYAYQTTPGVDIAAGDTGAVPEPSSIALFALGAAGLVAYRRRKLAA
jgi:hypothetical protein